MKRVVHGLISLLLHLWPWQFRARFGGELEERVRDDAERAMGQAGLAAVVATTGVLADLGWNGAMERARPTWRPSGNSRRREGWTMGSMLEGWMRDLKQAGRSLARSPGFTVAAAGTLALALGANAAIFGVVKGVLLDPLPMEEPDRLVFITASAPGSDFPDEFPVSAEFYEQYAEGADQLEGLATINGFTATFRAGDRVERAPLSWPTWNLFQVLGVEPILGRLPTEEDADVAMVLSHTAWMEWFGGDPDVIGKAYYAVDGLKEVVGIMPPDFAFPSDRVVAWLAGTTPRDVTQTGRFGMQLVGRMTPGATHESLRDQLQVLAARLPERYGGSPGYARLMEQHVPVVRSVEERLEGPVRLALQVLLAAVTLVLLIACANVANLFAVRAESRGRAFALRRAVGAGRMRIMRAQLSEALVVAGIAGAGAVALAALALPAFVAVAPEGTPMIGGVGLDAGTVGYTILATLVAGMICGLAPAIRASRASLDRLRDGSRGSTGRTPWGRHALVASQTALALVLLIGSGLLFKSFSQLSSVDPGYATEDVFTFQFAPEQDHLVDGPTWAAFHLDFMDRLRVLPGVDAVGIVENVPLDEGVGSAAFVAEGAGRTDDDAARSTITYAGGDYFRAMDIPVLRGRTFVREDLDTGDRLVLSRSAAESLFPGEDPVGRRVRQAGSELWFTVIGVVGDIHQQDFRTPPEPLVYAGLTGPRPDLWALSSPGYVVRTERAETIAPEIREMVRAVAPEAPMYRTYTMAFLAERSMMALAFTMLTLAVAAGLALVLGATGLYGTLSYVVSERRQEIGVRMALGAEATRVRRMVVVQGARVVAAGVIVGLMAAAAVTRGIGALLFGVEPLDPWIFGATAAAMLLVGVLASWVPAVRASRVDPLDAMRY